MKTLILSAAGFVGGGIVAVFMGNHGLALADSLSEPYFFKLVGYWFSKGALLLGVPLSVLGLVLDIGRWKRIRSQDSQAPHTVAGGSWSHVPARIYLPVAGVAVLALLFVVSSVQLNPARRARRVMEPFTEAACDLLKRYVATNPVSESQKVADLYRFVRHAGIVAVAAEIKGRPTHTFISAALAGDLNGYIWRSSIDAHDTIIRYLIEHGTTEEAKKLAGGLSRVVWRDAPAGGEVAIREDEVYPDGYGAINNMEDFHRAAYWLAGWEAPAEYLCGRPRLVPAEVEKRRRLITIELELHGENEMNVGGYGQFGIKGLLRSRPRYTYDLQGWARLARSLNVQLLAQRREALLASLRDYAVLDHLIVPPPENWEAAMALGGPAGSVGGPSSEELSEGAPPSPIPVAPQPAERKAPLSDGGAPQPSPDTPLKQAQESVDVPDVPQTAVVHNDPDPEETGTPESGDADSGTPEPGADLVPPEELPQSASAGKQLVVKLAVLRYAFAKHSEEDREGAHEVVYVIKDSEHGEELIGHFNDHTPPVVDSVPAELKDGKIVAKAFRRFEVEISELTGDRATVLLSRMESVGPAKGRLTSKARLSVQDLRLRRDGDRWVVE